MNAIEFADRHLRPYKIKGSEIMAEKCPYCGNRHKSTYKFNLNMQKEIFRCFHGDCGRTGHLSELCKDFNEVYKVNEYEFKKTEKQYKKPDVKTNELTETAKNYAYKRKISLTTLKAFNITQKDNNFVFPFYDEKGVLTFVKYRPIGQIKEGQRKAFREADTKPILFNMNNINTEEPVVITEGEFDAMAVYEAGYKNVVSVPSGASDFTWMETCWDWLSKLHKIILFGDNDDAGQEMIKKAVQKLGEYRCFIADHKHKDANEVLFYEGAEAILKAIETSRPIPKAGLINVADINILKPKKQSIKIGFKTIDKLLQGSRGGEVTVWTGKNGEGKSTVLSQVILDAVEQKIGTFVYSGELSQDSFKEWLYSQAAGKEYLKYAANDFDGYDVVFEPKIVSKIDKWVDGKLFLYDNSIKNQNIENSSILDLCRYSAQKYDCKVFVIDNLMTSDFETIVEKDFYRAQSKFVGELVHFAKAFDVHVHLVAHPKKTQGELSKEDISGSADITNRVDNVIVVERIKDSDVEYDTKLRVLKNRFKGSQGEAHLLFSAEDKRLYEIDSQGMCLRRKYSWNEEEVEEMVQTSGEYPF